MSREAIRAAARSAVEQTGEAPKTFDEAQVAKAIRESFEVGKRAGMQLQKYKHMRGYDVDRLVERLVGEG